MKYLFLIIVLLTTTYSFSFAQTDTTSTNGEKILKTQQINAEDDVTTDDIPTEKKEKLTKKERRERDRGILKQLNAEIDAAETWGEKAEIYGKYLKTDVSWQKRGGLIRNKQHAQRRQKTDNILESDATATERTLKRKAYALQEAEESRKEQRDREAERRKEQKEKNKQEMKEFRAEKKAKKAEEKNQ